MEEKDINEELKYDIEELKTDEIFMEYYTHFTKVDIDSLPKDDLDLIVNMFPRMKALAEANNMGIVEVMEAMEKQSQEDEELNKNVIDDKVEDDGILEFDDFKDVIDESIDTEKTNEEFEELKFNREDYLNDERNNYLTNVMKLGGRYDVFLYDTYKNRNDKKLYDNVIYEIFNSENRNFSNVIASNFKEIMANRVYDEDVISKFVTNYISYLAYESVNTKHGILTEKEIKDNFYDSKTSFYKSMTKEIFGVSFEYDPKAQELIDNKNQTKNLKYDDRLSLMNHYTNNLNDIVNGNLTKDEALNSSRQKYNALKALVENQSIWKKILHPIKYSEEKKCLSSFKNNLVRKYNIKAKEVKDALKITKGMDSTWDYDLFIKTANNLDMNLENNYKELIKHLKSEKMYTQNKEINELKNDNLNIKIDKKDVLKDVKVEKDTIKK